MLKKLFSNTGLIDEVVFHAGINIILGKYSKDKEAQGINGIGKSTLIRLIDYTFLSDSAQKIFLNKKYDFLRKSEHEITLEFEINNKPYFIQRDFSTKMKIQFGSSLHKLDNFEKSELKSILTNLYLPVEKNDVFFTGNKFRTLFDFFIKDDLDNQKRFEPLNFLKYNANLKEKAIFNFFLLDLPTSHLIDYNEQSKEYDKFKSAIDTSEQKIKIDTGKSIQEYRSERFNIEQRISLLEESLDSYQFIEKYKDIEKQLAKVTKQINDKLKEYNSLDIKVSKIKESYDLDQNVETQEIRKIYNEVLENFGNQVAKTLEEVIDFKNNILNNRKKYLLQKEQKLQLVIDSVLQDISILENKRSQLYKALDEKGALDSIKNTYEELVIEKTDLEKNLQLIKQIDEYQEMLTNLNVSISEVRRLISVEIKEFQRHIDDLRKLFIDILKNAIFVDESYENAYFDITPNPSSNRKKLPFNIEIEIPKADALGQSRLKIVAYDLMVFLYNIEINRKVPDFLIHDGVFHGISMKTKINTINYVYHKYLEHIDKKQFQYILTFNEDEIITNDDDSEYGIFDFDFHKSVIAEFQDVQDKTIFKRIFG
ncbi:hypothetical protein GCM10011416_14150 [Polaribacter pacificus]|uniref:DUF2326 domain-containing protein n=1 Tax=Polaribacter pacificus TaxID=1775173 RepID=A0A917HY08_9FLAO|nr:DUF2326 domain-containing protein [Polaribacter pacificus]GGG97352.1 hypothetical protein GCM10011416_14150 [Polaribacter pacificus]